MEKECRQHRRLAIRLPLEYYPLERGRGHALRTVCANISTGGVYFEVDCMEGVEIPARDSLLHVELTVPPGDGYFPYQGRVRSVAQVVRTDTPAPGTGKGRAATPRVGVGARFRQPLELAF